MSNNQGPSFDAQFKLDIPPSSSALATEHCRANRVQIENIGRRRHEQVRIEFLTANGILSAIYTVATFHSDVELVSLGDKIKNQFANCQLSKGKCEGKVKAQIMIEGLEDPDKAESLGELIEYLSPEVQNRKLVVIAPHGGHIEPGTDDQAEYVWKRLSQLFPDEVTLWMCEGFSNPHAKDAHERWHITATEISERSFPKLELIFGSKFEYSIAFHGWLQDSICVGGSKESADAGLIGEIKEAISDALIAKGSNIVVEDADCPGEFNGDDPCNIANRLGVKGIQIEQSRNARDDIKLRDAIAQAVVEVIESKINA
jgi:phage replication-related protein YjqB (UPF0714/DUF867 family)